MAKNDLIRIDTFHAEKALEDLQDALSMVPGGMKKAMCRALSRTIKGMRTDAVRQIRKDYNVPAKDVRSKMTVVSPKPADNHPRALLRAEGRMSVPLFRYGARPRVPVAAGGRRPRKGVSVQVKKTSGRKVIEGSFVQRPKNGGGVQIMKRETKERDSHQVLYGPSHLQALKDEGNLFELQELAEERLQKNIIHEADFVLQQAGLR
ncbi:hypothetical protein DPQ33_16370 [Oceanidesulfovibrio indonesiensis]|uniref:Uncharacterized protein n=1 Tax=Oceanidesulfovibrio indonesiensis TaxID=54767 RepID=A0A7M3MAW0_9BACT|nr:phage tail protein [Oceanidesulfovibrio indonesiensis]TVM15062.1 hypothetical protein DPQ33_16370 [Oceanidesulfovibrio indonesiensis]